MIKYIIGIVSFLFVWIIIRTINKTIQRKKLERERLQKLEKLKIKQLEEIRIAEERNRIIDEKIKAGTIIVSKKENWNEYERILSANNIGVLYHFTDKANIESIMNIGGLYSWEYLEKKKHKIAKPGGNLYSRNLDRKKKLQNFVRLSFVKNHPMLFIAQQDGRISNPVILEISKDVVYFEGTLFSNINAATTRIMPNVGRTPNHLNLINFKIMRNNYYNLSEIEKMQYQAEVLVYEKIPINYILNIKDFINN